MRRKRRSYKFTEKTHSKRGVVSCGISVVCLIMYMIFVYLSYKQAGQLSTYYGSFGVLAMVSSIGALISSIISFKEEDSFQLFPKLSLGTSILATLCWVGTYIMGFMRG